MRNADAHFRNVLVEEVLGAGRILDARADIERLATTVFLAQQRLAHRDGIERRHEGAHRQPVDRLAVRTFVSPFDPITVREALLREKYRGGQAFYVCPRIEDP